MDKQLRDKWVEALRSGKYQQGKNQLRNRNGYCCLGVLCDVVDPNKWIAPAESFGWRYEGNSNYLSPRLRESVGVSGDQELTVATMNDKGSSFAEIADYIEANIPVE